MHGRIQRGGTGGPDPPGIARLLIFAMMKFSVRPLLVIWTPLKKISGSGHAMVNCFVTIESGNGGNVRCSVYNKVTSIIFAFTQLKHATACNLPFKQVVF